MFSVLFTFVSFSKVKESVMTSASPVSNKVVILDAGHGIPDERC